LREIQQLNFKNHQNFNELVNGLVMILVGLETYLFVKVPRSRDSEVFESSCHLLLPV